MKAKMNHTIGVMQRNVREARNDEDAFFDEIARLFTARDAQHPRYVQNHARYDEMLAYAKKLREIIRCYEDDFTIEIEQDPLFPEVFAIICIIPYTLGVPNIMMREWKTIVNAAYSMDCSAEGNDRIRLTIAFDDVWRRIG